MLSPYGHIAAAGGNQRVGLDVEAAGGQTIYGSSVEKLAVSNLL
jgi:hypothetical protein